MEIKICCPKCQKALKAPESQAGKRAKCPGCGTIISIPEIVHEAEEVPEAPAPPPPPNMQNLLDEEQEYRLAEGPKVSTPAQEPMRRPCPMCGEMIVLGAAKCRYCDTILDERLRAAEKKKKRYSSEDSDLTGLDWFLVIICSGIGCIMGVVYMIQGKPKGWKMIGLSILCDIVKSVIWTIIQASKNQGQFGR